MSETMTLLDRAAHAILDEMDDGWDEGELRGMLPFARKYARAALRALGVTEEQMAGPASAVVVVPVEPDYSIINQGTVAALEHRLEGKHRNHHSMSNGGEIYAAYRAMISARPGAPE